MYNFPVVFHWGLCWRSLSLAQRKQSILSEQLNPVKRWQEYSEKKIKKKKKRVVEYLFNQMVTVIFLMWENCRFIELMMMMMMMI